MNTLLYLNGSLSVPGGKDEDDGEPDKMAMAIHRFGRLKRFIVASIASGFRWLKNRIILAIRGGPAGDSVSNNLSNRRDNDIALEVTDERDFQVSHQLSSAIKMYNFIPSR